MDIPTLEKHPKGDRLKEFWVAKEIGVLCFVPRNLENPSSAAELLEKIMNIAHAIGKSENLGTKIDKSELDSDWDLFLENI